MAPHAGIFFQGDRLTFVAITGRKSLECFSVETGENAGALLKAELDARRLRCRRVRIALERSLVTVKVLELPPVVGGSRQQMLRFEVERHVPFVADDALFDSADLPTTRDGPLRVLIAAGERKLLDRALRLLVESKLKATSFTPACHDLARLLGRGVKARRAVWAHRSGSAVDLVFLAGGELHLSRSVAVEDGEALAAEVNASLRLLRWTACDAVWISGDEAPALLGSSALATLGAPVSTPPYTSAASALVAQLPADQPGVGLLALATAVGRRRPILNLLPEGMRPFLVTPAQVATLVMVIATAGLGVASVALEGHRDRRYVRDLDAAARALEPEVQTVQQTASELSQKKRLLAAIATAEDRALRALPLMRELAEILPADAWLSTLNVDAKSLELTGQASTASQLIPLLEISPWLERVEFTSPVTRGRDKEQFRIKAAWEATASGPPPAITPERPPTGRPPAPPRPRAPGAGPGTDRPPGKGS